MTDRTPLDLVGVGVGPFNLSLAALLERSPDVKALFLERKERFDWHPEVMFADSSMQTSYLKDLVTPADPTNPNSFLNYLHDRNLFYAFLNTGRPVVSRREFEQYCAWVSERLARSIRFSTEVREVDFEAGAFRVRTNGETFTSRHLCVATGLTARVPDCARDLLGPNVFHAKSPLLRDLDLRGKSVMIVGGGQTGIEVFRNALQDRWGRAREINLLTPRKSLEPLDESPFTNEYFTPGYVDAFWDLRMEKKTELVALQKLASDGNTPGYLTDLYNDLYRLKHVERDERAIRILPCRKLVRLSADGGAYRLSAENSFLERTEDFGADVVILCTGFRSLVPKALEPLLPRLKLDPEGRFNFKKSYAVEWDGPVANRIYALNFSRHHHGIIDPQTSLMAWRSAVVVNDLVGRRVYATESRVPNFVEYGPVGSVGSMDSTRPTESFREFQ